MTQPETLTDTPTLSIEQRTVLLETEVAYQAARTELAAAEQNRYARLWSISVATGRDLRAVLNDSPVSVTRASLAGAIRRHAAPGDWMQLALFELEDR